MKRLLIFATSLFVFMPTAIAHVTLDPREAKPGYQIYQVRVPNERPVATTSLRLVVPDGVDLLGVQPVAGWTHEEVKDAPTVPVADSTEEPAARVREITWKGGQIQPGEFQIFSVSTRYTGSASPLIWKAYQTYAGGETVAWDDSSEKTPAPKITIRAAAPDAANSAADWTIWVSGLALLIALAALIVALKGRRVRAR